VRLGVTAVGRLKAGPERDLVARYQARAEALGRSLGVSAIEIVEITESRARRDADRRAEEAAAILARVGASVLVAFDERGRTVTSETFAERLGAWRDAGRPALAFVIGGPDGLDERIRRQADLVVAFGALTLPHQLVRVLVMEQVYRALTILAGHPYHRGDGDEP
jgi:23S rRNA (pseudouridine1915-N3)-methyltransferase